MLTYEEIARVTHEANRGIQLAQRDPAVSPPWDDAPPWQRESAIAGVITAVGGATPEELHQSWLDQKEADGWSYGPVKDADAKTHPCFVPYDELPEDQKLKDYVFGAIVRTLSALNDSSDVPELTSKSEAAEATIPLSDLHLREQALALAVQNSSGETPTSIVGKAEAFLSFLTGQPSDLSTKENDHD